MPTVLADSFTASLARLANNEQKQAQLTAFRLMIEPDRPGLQFHRIDKSKDPNFWSVRVSRDIRIIVHKTGGSLMLAYVDHHYDAYAWAERRRIEAHPATGAIQIVEVRERVEEIALPAPSVQAELAFDMSAPAPLPPIFASLDAGQLLSVGVPEDWLTDVGKANEETFFTLAAHLPQEAAEALLEFASTGILPVSAPATADPLVHPDTMRRFRILDGIEELQAALDAPFEKWAVFLHPLQRQVVERDYSGPVRVAGSAGTGKTVVALHRVMRMLRNDLHAPRPSHHLFRPARRCSPAKAGDPRRRPARADGPRHRRIIPAHRRGAVCPDYGPQGASDRPGKHPESDGTGCVGGKCHRLLAALSPFRVGERHRRLAHRQRRRLAADLATELIALPGGSNRLRVGLYKILNRAIADAALSPAAGNPELCIGGKKITIKHSAWPPIQQQAFLLVTVADLSYAEAAEVLSHSEEVIAALVTSAYSAIVREIEASERISPLRPKATI